MVKQSRDMTILLTRPAAQSLRFARELRQALGDVPIVISPLMAPQYLNPSIPSGDFAAVILVSGAAVDAAKRISAAGAVLPSLAYCVGNRTAAAAKAAGFRAHSANGDAAALLAMIVALKPGGPLLFLRGHDSSGNIENTLFSAGIETVSAIVYQQVAQPLTAKATALLHQAQPVIVPLFSPRSAHLFQSEIARISSATPLWVAALSPAIAAVLDGKTATRLQIATHSDSASMIIALRALLSLGGAP